MFLGVWTAERDPGFHDGCKRIQASWPYLHNLPANLKFFSSAQMIQKVNFATCGLYKTVTSYEVPVPTKLHETVLEIIIWSN